MKKAVFSLIIPIAPGRKAEILDSLKYVDYPKDKIEILVEEGTNASRNRNVCIAKANGKYIGILDDDGFVDKDILHNVEDFFEKHPEIDIIGGPQLTPESDGFFAKTSGYVIGSLFGSFKIRYRYVTGKLKLNADETMITTAVCFLRKEVFEKIRGFDTRLWPGEDPEFFARAKRNKLRIAYNPEVYLYHKRRPNLKSFAIQFFKYGDVALKGEKKKSTGILFFMPMFFLLYLILLPFSLNFFDSVFSAIALMPLIVYITIAVLSSFYLAIKNKSIASFFVMPFLYLVLHLSYGLGILKSFFDNVLRK